MACSRFGSGISTTWAKAGGGNEKDYRDQEDEKTRRREDGKTRGRDFHSNSFGWFIVLDGRGRILLLAKLLCDKDQIQNVDLPIPIGIWRGFTESVGDLHQIQDVDYPIAVDIGGIFDFEVYFAIKVG